MARNLLGGTIRIRIIRTRTKSAAGAKIVRIRMISILNNLIIIILFVIYYILICLLFDSYLFRILFVFVNSKKENAPTEADALS